MEEDKEVAFDEGSKNNIGGSMIKGDERRIMQLVGQIIVWDKVDVNQILKEINEFERLLAINNYQASDFGIKKIPTAYIPKFLENSPLIIATDKLKHCIYGNKAPYKIKSIKSIKASFKLADKLLNSHG